jgi:hypothetical protein
MTRCTSSRSPTRGDQTGQVVAVRPLPAGWAGSAVHPAPGGAGGWRRRAAPAAHCRDIPRLFSAGPLQQAELSRSGVGRPEPGRCPRRMGRRTLMRLAPEFRLDADGALENSCPSPAGSRTLAQGCYLPRTAAARPGHDGVGVRACRSEASLGLDRGPVGTRPLSHIAGSAPRAPGTFVSAAEQRHDPAPAAGPAQSRR